MSLIQLIYVSAAQQSLETAELDRILASSIHHNSPDAVTGMLLYADGSFMQVLEGEEAVVNETFARIEHDPRHTSVFVLDRVPIAARNFESWSMGFKRLDAQDATDRPGYAPFFERGFDAAQIGAHPGLALEMLIDFASNQSASAAARY